MKDLIELAYEIHEKSRKKSEGSESYVGKKQEDQEKTLAAAHE